LPTNVAARLRSLNLLRPAQPLVLGEREGDFLGKGRDDEEKENEGESGLHRGSFRFTGWTPEGAGRKQLSVVGCQQIRSTDNRQPTMDN
jgi:hypothetical protein